MSKANLIDEIAARTGIRKKDVDAVLDTLGEVAKAAIVSGSDLTIPGVGKIAPRQKAGRTGRNPATGQPIEIPASIAITFKAAKALKDAANS